MKIRVQVNGEDILYLSVLLLIFLTCLPLSMCLPTMMRNFLQIIAVIMYFIGLALYRDKGFIVMFCIAFAVMLIRVYATWRFKNSFPSCFFNVFTCWAFAFYGLLSYKSSDTDKQKKLLTLCILLMTVTAITTIIGIQRYPLAVRELGRGSTSYSGLSGSDFAFLKNEYRMNNIAGWNQLYGIVFLTPCLTNIYVKTKQKVYAWALLLCEICIIFSQLTIAFLLSFSLIVFSYIAVYRKRNILIVGLLLVLIVTVVLLNLKDIILYMVQFSSNRNLDMLSDKLNSFYYFLQGNRMGDVLSRTNLYMQSFNVFLEHPFFGMALLGVDSIFTFSHHSDFFDMLGYYGLFGAIILVIGSYYYIHYIKKNHCTEYSLTFILFLGLITLYVLNPIWYSPQVFIGAFMAPAFICKIYGNGQSRLKSTRIEKNNMQ